VKLILVGSHGEIGYESQWALGQFRWWRGRRRFLS